MYLVAVLLPFLHVGLLCSRSNTKGVVSFVCGRIPYSRTVVFFVLDGMPLELPHAELAILARGEGWLNNGIEAAWCFFGCRRLP